MEKKIASIYEKRNSYENLISKNDDSLINSQKNRCLAILNEETINKNPKYKEILNIVKKSFLNEDDSKENFNIDKFVCDEISLLEDKEIPKFLFHRYRYDQYPILKKIDDYPPYLQIEPSSICNYRCVFCYQTDKSFSDPKSKHMGVMNFDTYKLIVDQAFGNIEFLSLASRGEPLVAKDFGKMMEYSVGKFLNLKINTNASLLNEKRCHAILTGAIKTVVFSADAAEEPMYSKLRVGGKFEKVLKNIEMFKNIKEKQYPNIKILTRVSGVYVDENQSIDKMNEVWGDLVDQISFVKYNPWENVYLTEPNNIESPCSDLWRRMFVWFDGKVNPCDTDYKSYLSVDSIFDNSISDCWNSNNYNKLRSEHLNNLRKKIYPCNRCVTI